MRQPLLEGERGAVPFIVDRKIPFVTENRNGAAFTKIPGRFSICDSVNGNNRRYPKKVWEKNLTEGSALRQAIAKNAAFGMLEHPTNGQISLQSPICILVTEAKLQPATDAAGKQVNEVVGEIIVLNTPEGQKLRALIEAGYNPLVSSRGFGSVVRASDGVDEVQDDYVCEGWDPVLKPSFETAELWAHQEGQKPLAVQPEVALAEGQAPQSAPVASAPAAAAPAPRAEAQKPITENKSMDLNNIKSQITAFTGQKVPTDPKRFAEGLGAMNQLHQEIANYVAEDGKRSYQGSQLHEELQRVETAWASTAMAPSKQVTKLAENNVKTLRVTKLVVEAAVGLRRKLAESLSQNAEATQLVEELTERGQAWVAVADRRKQENADLSKKLDVACEALDIMAARYRQDMTDTGRHIITLEFAEKAQTTEIQKLLKEAKDPKDIIAIREKLEGKKPATPAPASTQEGTPAAGAPAPAAAPAAPAAGAAAPAPAAAAAPAKVQEGQGSESAPTGEPRVLVPSVHSVTESVDMVKRLSQSAK